MTPTKLQIGDSYEKNSGGGIAGSAEEPGGEGCLPRQEGSEEGLRLPGGGHPEDGRQDLAQAMVDREGLGIFPLAHVRGHQAAVKIFNKIIHFQLPPSGGD